jgi:hypothetical protein
VVAINGSGDASAASSNTLYYVRNFLTKNNTAPAGIKRAKRISK